jgi:hypothetical protein
MWHDCAHNHGAVWSIKLPTQPRQVNHLFNPLLRPQHAEMDNGKGTRGLPPPGWYVAADRYYVQPLFYPGMVPGESISVEGSRRDKVAT